MLKSQILLELQVLDFHVLVNPSSSSTSSAESDNYNTLYNSAASNGVIVIAFDMKSFTSNKLSYDRIILLKDSMTLSSRVISLSWTIINALIYPTNVLINDDKRCFDENWNVTSHIEDSRKIIELLFRLYYSPILQNPKCKYI
jgi:hypothetical protein